MPEILTLKTCQTRQAREQLIKALLFAMVHAADDRQLITYWDQLYRLYTVK